MGHYYVDFMCEKCGKLHCICPVKKPKKKKKKDKKKKK